MNPASKTPAQIGSVLSVMRAKKDSLHQPSPLVARYAQKGRLLAVRGPWRPALSALAGGVGMAHVQEDTCPGSRWSFNRKMLYRAGSTAHNYGTCEARGNPAATTAHSNLRKHK